MKVAQPTKDLFVLVADKNMQAAVEAMLGRREALGIRSIAFDVRPHPRNDPGCRREATEYLRPLIRLYRHAVVLFDHDGCGEELKSPSELEETLRNRLSDSGWSGRCAVIVIAPELENWIWSPSKKVDEICGWSGRIPALRDWVAERFEVGQDGKPTHPKEAFIDALREIKRVPSSALFREIAGKVSWTGCTDPAFLRFQQILQDWFSIKISE